VFCRRNDASHEWPMEQLHSRSSQTSIRGVRQVWTSSIADKTLQLTDSLIFAMSFNCFGDWNLTRRSFAPLSSVSYWIKVVGASGFEPPTSWSRTSG
jgi:hypothetical protein